MNIKAIAREACVSPATASLVRNNKADVSEERRRAVQELENKYGYVRSSRSRGAVSILLVKYATPGMVIEHKYVFEVVPTMEGSYHDISDILAQNPNLPTAFFASNDSMGVGLLKALKKHGVSVPDQVSVIGFDDLHFCTVSNPMLTTMAVPKETMGRLAVQRVYERVTSPDSTRDCIKTLIFPRLVERESVLAAQ